MTERSLRTIRDSIPAHTLRICRELNSAGYEAYVVGGAIRDLLLGRIPGDYDVATSATPAQMRDVFRRLVPTGEKHGTMTVLTGDHSVEVTTFRSESDYSNHRSPDSVDYVTTIEEDLSRRDFTINGMAYDPANSAFIDPFDGERDLEGQIIRAIGDPALRFTEDALRILRALRFASQLEFDIHPATRDGLSESRKLLRVISMERIRDEIVKIVISPCPGIGLRLMRDTGVLEIVLPELWAGVGVLQRGRHVFDVFEHSVAACESAASDNLTVRLAALLHDIGKPACLKINEDGERTFNGHADESARQAEALLQRLRFPNATTRDVTHLIRHHMFNYTAEWTDAAIRRFLARVGIQHVPQLFLLRKADSDSQTGKPADPGPLAMFSQRINSVIESDAALSRRDLAVSGDDLRDAGIPPGPLMGVVLDHLLETVLDDPGQNTRETLLRIAGAFFESRLREDNPEE